MEQVEQEETLVRLTNRHIARLLDKLAEINTAEVIKDAVKKEFWFLSTDIKEQVLNKEQKNGKRKD